MKAAIGGVLFSFVIIAVLCVPVGASKDWSWTRDAPRVAISETVRFDNYSQCPHFQVEYRIASVDNFQNVCVHSEGAFRFVTFFLDGVQRRAAVGFGQSNELYLLDNLCRGSTRCFYVPQSDSLIQRVYMGNNRYQAFVTTDFSRRLERNIHSNGTIGYTLNTSSQEDRSLAENVSEVSIGAIGFSRNGQWAAIEIQDKAIATVNIASGSVKQIWRTGQQYGFGHDPEMELAISNDGEYVAVMGENAGFLIIQNSPECGATMPTVMIFDQNCRIASIQTGHFIPSFRFGSRPEFDEEGGSLRFFAASFTSPSRFIVVRASNYSANSRLSYLAMGDSFASGEGESSDAYYLMGTNNEHERCHTSRRSYPFILNSSISEAPGLVRSVACSGAKIKDVIGNDANYWGQANRLKTAGLTVSNKLIAQTQALIGYIPGRIHQATVYSYVYPQRATIGIGGNDAGLMDKLKTCAMPGRCEWVKDATARYKIALEVERLYNTALGLFQKLKNESPMTKLYVVGYPLVIRPHGDCDPVTSILLDSEERLFMDQGIRLLNSVLKRAATVSQLHFIDIQDSLIGYRLCEHNKPAINSLRLGDDISPIRSLPSFMFIGAESFHPTPTGHQIIARVIDRAMLNNNSSVSCDECNDQLSDYWTYGAATSEVENQYATDFLDEPVFSGVRKDMNIKLEALSLLPESSTTVEVHSETRTLGNFKADISGALQVNVRLPDDLGEGYHTVHIRGTSYTHQKVDYYQAIFYRDDIAPESTSYTSPSVERESQSFSGRGLQTPQNGEVLGLSYVSPTSFRSPLQTHTSHRGWTSVVVLCLVIIGSLGMVLAVYKILIRIRDRGG